MEHEVIPNTSFLIILSPFDGDRVVLGRVARERAVKDDHALVLVFQHGLFHGAVHDDAHAVAWVHDTELYK